MKANIKETNKERSDEHFKSRQKEKNALAIASNQSQPISSFETVKSKFTETLENAVGIFKGFCELRLYSVEASTL